MSLAGIEWFNSGERDMTRQVKALKPGFPMWDRPNQESMVGKGLICKQVASDGRRRANPIDRGPIGGRAGLKQAC